MATTVAVRSRQPYTGRVSQSALCWTLRTNACSPRFDAQFVLAKRNDAAEASVGGRMLADLWTTFKEGIGFKKFAVSTVVAGIITVFYFGAQYFAVAQLLAIPHWAVWCVATLALLLFRTLQYADGLRRELQPKIELSADPARGCVVETPVVGLEIRNGMAVPTKESKALSLRVLAQATTKATPKNVAAFLTKFEKQRIGGGGWESSQHHELVQLTWTGYSNSEINLSTTFPRFINVLHISEDDNLIAFWGAGMPLTLRDFFKALTTYRLTVSVVAEGMTDAEITFEVVWKGQWNTLEMRPVKAA